MTQGIAVALEKAISAVLSDYVYEIPVNVCSVLQPVALAGTTLYLLIMGYAVIRGETQDSMRTVLWNWFKIALISGIALNFDSYQSVVIDGVDGIQEFMLNATGGASTITQQIDAAALPYGRYAQRLYAESGTTKETNLLLFAAGTEAALAQISLLVVTLGLYLLAKVSLALVFAIGPVFILCAMFPATKHLTEKWLAQALSCVILMVLVSINVAMTTGFAEQYALHLFENLGTTAVIRDAITLLIVSGILMTFMLNTSSIASALSGGASISGMGQGMAGGVSRLIGSLGPKGGAGAGGTIAGSGSRSGSSSLPASTMPSYQRNVLDKLRKK